MSGKKMKDLAAMVSTKAKSALTRQLNKEKRLLPFTQGAPTKVGARRKGTATKSGGGGQEGGGGKTY